MTTPSQTYFYGQYTNSISAKGQASIPKKFRDSLDEIEAAGGFVLLPGQDCCLYLYTHLQFSEIRTRVRELAVKNNSPEFFRSFMESVVALDPDNQGRFVIPQTMRDLADLTGKEVTFIGMDDRIEIWNPDVRNSQRKEQEASYAQLRETGARDIFGI